MRLRKGASEVREARSGVMEGDGVEGKAETVMMVVVAVNSGRRNDGS